MTAAIPIPVHGEPERPPEKSIEDRQLLQTVLGYYTEAKMARSSGPAARDATWDANVKAYWSHYDASGKAKWQATEQMPEVPNFVERIVASMRQALVRAGEWGTISDPIHGENEVSKLIAKVVWAMLARSGRNATGQKIGFSHEFGDIVKSGTLMALCASVTWEDGSIRIRAVDPRNVWLDPTGRGLYRIQKKMVDRNTLETLKDSDGKHIYNQEAVARLSGTTQDEDKSVKEDLAGHPQEVSSARKQDELLEFLCDVVDADGKTVKKNWLVVVGNEREILRSEPNPFWHERDWIVYAPMIAVPFSVYGRTYVEGFRQLASTFTEMTNMLLDSVYVSSIKAFMGWPEALEDPTQFAEGITPGKVYTAAEEWPHGEDFIKPVDLGNVKPEAFQMWAGVKSELQEAGQQSELAVGQLPTSGEHTAAAVNEASGGTRALNSSMATDIEEQILNPILELTWWTTLQNFDLEQDPEIAAELGPEIAAMIVAQREGFRKKRWRMKANGLTGMMERGQRLRGVLGLLNIVGSNETLSAAFTKEYSLTKLLVEMVRDFGIDPARIEKDQAEKQAEAREKAKLAAAAGGGSSGGPGASSGGGSALAEADPAPAPSSQGPGEPI